MSFTGEVSSSSMVPVRLLFGDQPHGDHGDQEQRDGAGEAQQRPDDHVVQVDGLRLAHHLRLQKPIRTTSRVAV